MQLYYTKWYIDDRILSNQMLSRLRMPLPQCHLLPTTFFFFSYDITKAYGYLKKEVERDYQYVPTPCFNRTYTVLVQYIYHSEFGVSKIFLMFLRYVSYAHQFFDLK